MTSEYSTSINYKFIDNDKFDLSIHDITEFLKEEVFANPEYCYIVGTQDRLMRNLFYFIESRDIERKIEITMIGVYLSVNKESILIDMFIHLPEIRNEELEFQFLISRIGTGYLCEVFMDKQFIVFANS